MLFIKSKFEICKYKKDRDDTHCVVQNIFYDSNQCIHFVMYNSKIREPFFSFKIFLILQDEKDLHFL